MSCDNIAEMRPRSAAGPVKFGARRLSRGVCVLPERCRSSAVSGSAARQRGGRRSTQPPGRSQEKTRRRTHREVVEGEVRAAADLRVDLLRGGMRSRGKLSNCLGQQTTVLVCATAVPTKGSERLLATRPQSRAPRGRRTPAACRCPATAYKLRLSRPALLLRSTNDHHLLGRGGKDRIEDALTLLQAGASRRRAPFGGRLACVGRA